MKEAFFKMVRQAGLEPARPCGQQILSLNNEVFIVDYPEAEFPEGWDIADKFPENWDLERFTSLFDTAKHYVKENSRQEVAVQTEADKESGKSKRLIPDIIPYDGQVNGIEIVDELVGIIKRHVILPDNEALAIAYWILQGYNIKEFTFAPRLLIISPEKRCGKSTLLQLLKVLCYKSYPIGNCTPAVLYRIIKSTTQQY